MAEQGYSLLRIIIIDSFWPKQVNELDLTGHTQLEGTNGAGKTSLMRLLPLFYGMRPSDIVSKIDQAKNFADFYLPRESSILVYEYQRPYGQKCMVLATSDGRGVHFKFIDAAYDNQHFIVQATEGSNSKTFPIIEIERNYRQLGANPSSFLGIDKYRQVIQNLRSGKKLKDIRLLQNRFSFCDQPSPHIDKVVNGTIEKNLDFDAVKRMLVAIASDHLARNSVEEKEQISLNKTDITSWLADIQASRAIKKVADKISVWQTDFTSLEGLLTKLEHLHFEIINHQTRLEEKQLERAQLKSDSLTKRNVLEQALNQATSAFKSEMNALQDKIDADSSKVDLLDEDKFNFDEDDASSYQIKADETPQFQAQLNEVIRIIDAFEGDIAKIGQKFEKLIQQLEVQKLTELTKNKDKTADISAKASTELSHINQVYYQQLNDLNAQLHQEDLAIQKEQQSLLHQLSSTKEQLGQINIPIELSQEIETNQQSLATSQQEHNQLLQQKTALQAEKYQTEKQQDKHLNQRSEDNRHLEQLRQDYHQVEQQLLPISGSLHHFLDNEPLAKNWQDTIGRLLTTEQLSRCDLNPQWLSEQKEHNNGGSLYGLSIDLQQLPCNDSLFLDEAQLREKRSCIELKLNEQNEKIAQLDEHLKYLNKEQARIKIACATQEQALKQSELTLAQLNTQQQNLVVKKQLALKTQQQILNEKVTALRAKQKDNTKKQQEFSENKADLQHELSNDKLEKCMLVESDRDNQVDLLNEQQQEIVESSKQRLRDLKKQQKSDVDKLDPEGEIDKCIVKQKALEASLEQCARYAQLARNYQSFINDRYCHRDALVELNQNRKLNQRNLSLQHEDVAVKLSTEINELKALIKKLILKKQTTDELLIAINDNKRLCEMSAIAANFTEQEPSNSADLVVSFCQDFHQQFKVIEKRLSKQLSTFTERFRREHSGSELFENWQSLLNDNDTFTGAQALFKYRLPISELLNSAEQKQQSTYQLVTVNATMINEFYQHIENFGQRIKQIGKQLSTKVTALAHFDALADISVTTVMKQEELDYWSPLHEFAKLFELHKDQLRDGLGEIPDDLVYAMQKLADYLPSEGFALAHNNLFDLEFTIIEKGQVKHARNARQLKKVSSTGLSYLAMLSLFAGLLAMLRGDSKHASQIILPVDELGELAAENIDLLLKMFNDNHISMLSASPSTDRHILSLYNRHYKLKDNKIYHAEIPQSRLDELLAMRKNTTTATGPVSDKATDNFSDKTSSERSSADV